MNQLSKRNAPAQGRVPSHRVLGYRHGARVVGLIQVKKLVDAGIRKSGGDQGGRRDASAIGIRGRGTRVQTVSGGVDNSLYAARYHVVGVGRSIGTQDRGRRSRTGERQGQTETENSNPRPAPQSK